MKTGKVCNYVANSQVREAGKMEISPKADILAHVLDATHGKINGNPIISVMQSADITYPDFTGIAPVPTVMAISRASQTFEVHMVMLTDPFDAGMHCVSYGSHDDYVKAIQIAQFYGIIDR